MFLVSPNDVPIPKIKGKKRKSIIAVDEVSSAGRKFIVRRSGEVIEFGSDDSDNSEDAYETDENDDSEVETPIKEVKFTYFMTFFP